MVCQLMIRAHKQSAASFFDYLGNKNLISYKRKRAAQTVEEKKKERAIFELLPTSYSLA